MSLPVSIEYRVIIPRLSDHNNPERLDIRSAHVTGVMPFPVSSTLETEKAFDPSRVRRLCPGGVVLCPTGLMDLLEQSHGCMMACENSDANM